MGLIPKTTVILASGSPRRKELLTAIGISFAVQVPKVDETIDRHWTSGEAVERLSEKKGLAIARQLTNSPCHSWRTNTILVIAADTVVVIDGQILGKPKDEEEARQMLRRLSGRRHQVYSGLALFEIGLEAGQEKMGQKVIYEKEAIREIVQEELGLQKNFCEEGKWEKTSLRKRIGHVHTEVQFRRLCDETIRRYVATGEPMDKAGSYAVQGLGATFIEAIHGDFFTVVGLPLALLNQFLEDWEYRLF